nr:immunoglobulin light chain junction region [Macaca mulatta]
DYFCAMWHNSAWVF